MTAAMQKRPAPDLLWRTAVKPDTLGDVAIQPGDKIVLSATLATLEKEHPSRRPAMSQRCSVDCDRKRRTLVHACPAYEMAMGTMAGVLAALLEAGEIEALPGALLIRLKPAPVHAPLAGWPRRRPAPVALDEKAEAQPRQLGARASPASAASPSIPARQRRGPGGAPPPDRRASARGVSAAEPTPRRGEIAGRRGARHGAAGHGLAQPIAGARSSSGRAPRAAGRRRCPRSPPSPRSASRG